MIKFFRMLCYCSLLGMSYSIFAADTVTNSALNAQNYYPIYPPITYSPTIPRTLIDRGAYLVKIGDCISCHTDVAYGGKPFAGGLPLNTPFGVFYAPNITPDKKTGIGTWTDDNFIKALHEGITPSGSYYFPVFPYTSFTKVSKEDLLAIKAYLMSIPPVYKPNRPPGAPWPFSWRPSQFFWRLLFFKPEFYENDARFSAGWNRGAYLVQGLGHCGECHTPRNNLGAMREQYYLTGALIDGYWAPNITHYGLQQATSEEVANVFQKYQLINKAGPVRGPMAEVDHNSLVNLSDADIKDIALYLQTLDVTPLYTPPTKSNVRKLNVGRKVYVQVCAICHDSGVAGAPKIFDTANWTARFKAGGYPTLYHSVIFGLNNMPAKGACVNCSDYELEAAVDFILAKSQSHPELHTIAGDVASKPDTSIAHGQMIYKQNCALCHDTRDPKLGDSAEWRNLLHKKGMPQLMINAIQGVGTMPALGGCSTCTRADVIAAVKYMVTESVPGADVSLW